MSGTEASLTHARSLVRPRSCSIPPAAVGGPRAPSPVLFSSLRRRRCGSLHGLVASHEEQRRRAGRFRRLFPPHSYLSHRSRRSKRSHFRPMVLRLTPCCHPRNQVVLPVRRATTVADAQARTRDRALSAATPRLATTTHPTAALTPTDAPTRDASPAGRARSWRDAEAPAQGAALWRHHHRRRLQARRRRRRHRHTRRRPLLHRRLHLQPAPPRLQQRGHLLRLRSSRAPMP